METPLVPPVPARSAVLSLLLGADPPSLSGREIVGAMGLFGVSESTTRVALTRMVAGGDLTRSDAVYTLSERLRERQRAVEPPEQRPWNGDWEMAVVTAGSRTPSERVALRAEMRRQRMGELREGVWLRPANVQRAWSASVRQDVTFFSSQPTEDPGALAGELWDLPAWSDRARQYLDALAAVEDEPTRYRTMVAAVHHLQTDPLLPAELLPPQWPGAALAAVYADYRAWLRALPEGFFTPTGR